MISKRDEFNKQPLPKPIINNHGHTPITSNSNEFVVIDFNMRLNKNEK